MKKYLAELVGTFALTLVVGLSIVEILPLSGVVLAGLTLALFAYSIGHISGAHINPAITLAAWLVKKINNNDAGGYLLAQFVGAGLAMVIVRGIAGDLGVVMASAGSYKILLAEIVGAFFFAFGVAAIMFKKVPDAASGLVAGGSLLFGLIAASGMGSAGILNPAVAFGIQSFNWVYVLGPIIGAGLGMLVYRHLAD